MQDTQGAEYHGRHPGPVYTCFTYAFTQTVWLKGNTYSCVGIKSQGQYVRHSSG